MQKRAQRTSEDGLELGLVDERRLAGRLSAAAAGMGMGMGRDNIMYESVRNGRRRGRRCCCAEAACGWRRWSTKRRAQVALGLVLAAFMYWHLLWRACTPALLADPRGGPVRHCAALEGYREPVAARRIAIVTFFGGMNAAMRAASIANKHQYANLHGYDVVVADDEVDPSRPAAWSKFPIIKRLLPDYDFVAWVDADALFLNTSIRLEHVVDDAHDLFFARDESDINSGVFVVRNSDFALWWLDEAWAQTWLLTGSHVFKYEQRAIQYLYGSDALLADAERHGREPHPRMEETRKRTKVVQYCALNSNICEEFWTALVLWRRTRWEGWFCDNVYERGDFVVHFAGKAPSFYRNWIFLAFYDLTLGSGGL